MKEKPKQGFIKEISKRASPQSLKQAFEYSKSVNKVAPIQNMAFDSRNREFKSVKENKLTNFSVEQTNAKQSHKGK